MTDEVTPTPTPAPSATGSSSARAAAQPPIGVTTQSATSIAAARPSIPPRLGSRETRWASTMYSAKRAAFANAHAIPSGSAEKRTSLISPTPATAASRAAAFRGVRAPAAASATTGTNSIAATVPRGTRSIAR
jgi:hypothetical protein